MERSGGGSLADHYLTFIIVLIVTLFIVWQAWELAKYGEDGRINIFTTGDFQKIFH